MSNSVYGKDSTINGNINISGELQNKNKVFNKVIVPQLVINTGNTYNPLTLGNPLAETIVLNTSASTNLSVNLPIITIDTLGMTFNFIKTNVSSIVRFYANTTDQIIKQLNKGTTGNTSEFLLSDNITSIQLIVLNISGYKWVVMNPYFPPQISNPVGSIITMSVYTTLPPGYLNCDGAYYANTYYPDLFAVIGYVYGQLNYNFYVPNFNNGSFLRGFGGLSGIIGVQQDDNIKGHTHNVSTKTFQHGSANDGERVPSMVANSGDYGPTDFNSGLNPIDSSYNETRPINYAVYYYIKY